MEVSHTAVYPVGVPPALLQPPARVRMKDYQGMPGTLGSLVLRFGQMIFALLAFSFMISTPDFGEVTAFKCIIAASLLQSLWSFMVALIDCYALLVQRCLHNSRLVFLLTMGDGITSTVIFAAACSTAGITVLIDNDLNQCALNHCQRYEAAAAMAFLSWIMAAPSFLLAFWLLATS